MNNSCMYVSVEPVNAHSIVWFSACNVKYVQIQNQFKNDRPIIIVFFPVQVLCSIEYPDEVSGCVMRWE